MKILGTMIYNKLSWDENCKALIKKVNSRMQLTIELQIENFGPLLDPVLQKYTWAIMCGLGTFPNMREHRRFGNNAKVFSKISIKTKL